MATLIELARRVKSESGRSGTGPASVATAFGDDLRIINAVRDAWDELQLEPRQWKWMIASADVALAAGTVTNSVSSLGLAASFWRWIPESDDYRATAYDVTNATSEWPVRFVSYDRFRAAFMVGDHQAGPPQYWSQAPSGELLIGPKPDSANYKLRAQYSTLPTSLEADGDEPNMPQQYHPLLMWRALMQVGAAGAAVEHYARARDKADFLYDALLEKETAPITITAVPLA